MAHEPADGFKQTVHKPQSKVARVTLDLKAYEEQLRYKERERRRNAELDPCGIGLWDSERKD
jgi:hypothetical protein